jgi:hypothetical protein
VAFRILLRYLPALSSLRLADAVIKDAIFMANFDRVVDYNASWPSMAISTFSAPALLLVASIHEKFGLKPPMPKICLVHRRAATGATHYHQTDAERS